MKELDRFKASVADFLGRTGMSRSDLGRHACNDASFVSDMMDGGRVPKLPTIEKVENWMDLYKRDPDAALGRKPRSEPPALCSAA